MNPLEATRYIIFAAIMVLPLFLGLRLLMASDKRRESWRDRIKNRFYLSRRQFKTVSIALGCLLLAIGLVAAWFQILHLMGDG